MTAWDNAELTFLTAAAKVYAALKVANPTGSYSSSLIVTLNIDGAEYSCRCDCTGVIQCIIRLMGYDPNWGVSSIPGHVGDGWYLTDATASFINDSNGNLTEDWVVLPFDANDARPGDIRAAANHSHCDIFVAYIEGSAYGLNAGSGPNTGGQAIPKSCDAGVKYLQDAEDADLAATWTIQDNDAATVLRYIRGSDSSSDSGSSVQSNVSQSLKSLDIRLQFIEPLTFRYLLRNSEGQFIQKEPGYLPVNSCYPSGSTPATDSYGDAWLEFIPSYIARYAESDTDWRAAIENGLVMLYTLDNSDPLEFGRTVILNEDGTNDYASSKDLVPIIRTQFPVHFRCVLTDSITHSHDYGRSSAFLTTQSADNSITGVASLIKAHKNSTFMLDASGNIPECDDDHGYLFLHDEDTTYDRNEYSTWVNGLEV